MSRARESKRPPGTAPRRDAPGVTPAQLPPGLWLVATPIGNVADITLRALDVLRRADLLACEDTRRTRRLLGLHDVALGGRPVVAYHDRSAPARRERLLAALAAGASVAYVSDAGTPLIADPGFRLAEAARAAGHAVHVLPGPSAVLAALCASGLPTDRFLFAGFLPPKAAARRRALAEIAGVPATLVLFEAPHRLAASFGDMAAVLGADRPAAIARELTKVFEEVRRGTLGDLAAALDAGPPPKGEVVVVIGQAAEARAEPEPAELDAALRRALATMSVRDAARSVAERTGASRRDLYARALALTGAGDR